VCGGKSAREGLRKQEWQRTWRGQAAQAPPACMKAECEYAHREQALQDLLASRRYGRYLTTHYTTGRLPLDAVKVHGGASQ